MPKRRNSEDQEEKIPKLKRVRMTKPVRIPVPEYMLEGWGLIGPDNKLTWLSLYYYINRDM